MAKRSVSLLGASLQAACAGGAGGALAAVVVELTDLIQEQFWGSPVLQGLPSDTPLSIALLQGHGAGALLVGLLVGQLPWPWRR